MAASYPDGLAALRNIARPGAIPLGTLARHLPAPRSRYAMRLAAVRRVWIVEVSREAGRQRLPLLLGLRFRIVRKWHVSDIWLMLYRHRHRHRHRHHHPYQRQPPHLSRPPPWPGRGPRYRVAGPRYRLDGPATGPAADSAPGAIGKALPAASRLGK